MPMVLLQTAAIDNDQFGSITTTPLAVAGLRPPAQTQNPSLHPRGFGVDMALVTTVTIPTNTPEAGYLGEESFTFVPEMAFGKDLGDVRLLSNIGGRLRNQDTPPVVGYPMSFFRLALPTPCPTCH